MHSLDDVGSSTIAMVLPNVSPQLNLYKWPILTNRMKA